MSAYLKTKTAAKLVHPRSPQLETLVLDTMKRIADIVGATLGPGGSQVLIERQEYSLPPLVTKDGVTVMTSLGFANPVAHTVMESARDAAVRTVSEAGDGTTTATVLAYAIVREAQKYHRAHPEVPPQRIVRELQSMFQNHLEPMIRKWSRKVEFDTEEGQRLLRAVATVSANGETELADAVLKCFTLVGDKGNVTLSEKSGPSGYEVEKTEGYPFPVGYEECLGKFMTAFLNDPANNRVYLEQPAVILYNGTLTDINTIYPLLNHCQNAFNNRPGMDKPHDPALPSLRHPGVVVVANGFTDAVVGALMLNWTQGSLKVLPVRTPRSPLQNGEVHFIDDIAAVTGATVFNPVSLALDTAHQDLRDLGKAREFEMHRFRANLIGVYDEDELIDRIEVVEQMAATSASELDKRLLQERVACLSGGIAKLNIVGSSTGDIKERKDRADDAIRAVQGAMKHGVLPGGCWTLNMLSRWLGKSLFQDHSAAGTVLGEALKEPFFRLLTNVGMTPEQIAATYDDLAEKASWEDRAMVYDAANGGQVEAYSAGILDSTPAVLEALRNSIAIATLLGTLGGVVVFERDHELERAEAMATGDYERNAAAPNPADERW